MNYNRANRRECNKWYWKTSAGKALRARIDKKSKQKHREKHTARSIVSRAVAQGKLIPQPCIFCSEPKTQAHHHDYTKPLSVMWMCGPCHKSFHIQLTNL